MVTSSVNPCVWIVEGFWCTATLVQSPSRVTCSFQLITVYKIHFYQSFYQLLLSSSKCYYKHPEASASRSAQAVTGSVISLQHQSVPLIHFHSLSNTVYSTLFYLNNRCIVSYCSLSICIMYIVFVSITVFCKVCNNTFLASVCAFLTTATSLTQR